MTENIGHFKLQKEDQIGLQSKCEMSKQFKIWMMSLIGLNLVQWFGHRTIKVSSTKDMMHLKRKLCKQEAQAQKS